MKIFICWSGRWGQNAANEIKNWLCKDALKELKQCDVRVSTEIAKGALWFEELRSFLDQACAALVCLTRDALRSPWVHYEVGAIATAMREQHGQKQGYTGLAPIFPLLLGVKPGEITGPLAAFQSTAVNDAQDMRRLINDLTLVPPVKERASTQGPAELSEKWLDTWQKLQDRLNNIQEPALVEVFSGFDRLFRRKTFQESTFECVSQKWQERYDGARDTWAALLEWEGTIEQTCRPYVVDMYKALIAKTDQYAMALSLLVGSEKFDIDDHGHVKMKQPGIAEACERSRKGIKSLIVRLTDSHRQPLFDEAFRFEVAESVAEKKSFIHRGAQDMKTEKGKERTAKEGEWQASDWEYDRILYSLCLEQQVKAHKAPNGELEPILNKALEHAMTNLEKARAREGSDALPQDSYLMSLSYALGPLECAPHGSKVGRVKDLQYLIDSIRDLLKRHRSAHEGRPAEHAAATFASFEAVLEDSLKRVAGVFAPALKGAATDAVVKTSPSKMRPKS